MVPSLQSACPCERQTRRGERVMFTFTAFPKRTKRYARLPQHLGEKQSSAARRALRRSARYLAPLVFSVLLVPAAASAQVLYGSLVGNVTDPNGAAVPDAKIEITNVATGDVSTVNTDDRGAFVLNDLQVGI